MSGGTMENVAHSMAAAVAGVIGDKAVSKLVSGISSDNEQVRTEAWLGAGCVGSAAVGPLAEVMTDKDIEIARAAKHGLWRIVRHAGRPMADEEKEAVVGELIELLANERPDVVRREALWMLSEISGDECVEAVAAILTNAQLREDARMALERIPGNKSLRALKAGLKTAPDDFKANIAQSLRQRGVKIPGLPCVKMVPVKKTNVKPLVEGDTKPVR